jgi:hypothetical protein
MVLFLHSDENYEQMALCCIKSLTHKITDDVKIVYYTIGFDSHFEFKNLITHRIEIDPAYPSFEFYKAKLALLTMDLFPDDHYVYADSDVIFSRRFSFDSLKHNQLYPLACFGPHEYIFIANSAGDSFNEVNAMVYFNVHQRSQRYVFSCFFSFNTSCKDFMEEWESMCSNKYLVEKGLYYYPFRDETSFNVCLWKRGATENYGFGFVNTHVASTILDVEEGASNRHYDNAVDMRGASWEYVKDSSKVMLYHGIKDPVAMQEALDYLLV